MRSPCSVVLGTTVVLIFAILVTSRQCRGHEKSSLREFVLTYAFEFDRPTSGNRVRIWMPLPTSSPAQDAEIISYQLPDELSTAVETKYGNRIGYVEIKLDEAESWPERFEITYRIKRREVRSLDAVHNGEQKKLTKLQLEQFLSANSLVPVGGKPADLLLGDVDRGGDPLELARKLYAKVDLHMKYDKSRPGYGNGDATWACDSRFGNCTDFHSLFISLARTSGMPARFEIGFPLPAERGAGKIGGYHCWAYFHTDAEGWVPVDISEADKHPEMKEYYFGSLTEDRVTFSTGRDIELVPRQAGQRLNYFVYPYVEIDDQPLSREKIQLDFEYRDL